MTRDLTAEETRKWLKKHFRELRDSPMKRIRARDVPKEFSFLVKYVANQSFSLCVIERTDKEIVARWRTPSRKGMGITLTT